MINKTLENTKQATFSVLTPHPDPAYKNFPFPNGTGFFFDPRGYFITARHVIQKIDINGNAILDTTKGIPELLDISKLILSKPGPSFTQIKELILVSDFPQFDLVILKADFEKHKTQESLKGKIEFNNIYVDFSIPLEGEPVYAFGYPLAEHTVKLHPTQQGMMIGTHTYFPRTTSLIISSHHDKIGPIIKNTGFPEYYVIDKALNYGNSGGPIVIEETGRVISVCTRFQPVMIKQQQGNVAIPSLYGITVSLKNIEKEILAL
ncbi:MAG: serine protease [Candidatus Paceibacterota bacterium]